MIICGVWTFLFTIPIFVALKDRRRDHPAPSIGLVGSYRELFRSIKRLAKESPNPVLPSLPLPCSATAAGVFTFGGVLAAGTFGFEFGEVVIFGVAANVVAGLATIGFGLIDDKIGPKRVIIISLVSLVVLGLGVFIFHEGGKPVFWGLGLALCLFVGPAQSAARSFLARLIPEGKSGELFGLYATTGRAVSFLAPTMFGLFIGLGTLVTAGSEESAQHWGILGVVTVLFVGLVFALFVRDPSREVPARTR